MKRFTIRVYSKDDVRVYGENGKEIKTPGTLFGINFKMAFEPFPASVEKYISLIELAAFAAIGVLICLIFIALH